MKSFSNIAHLSIIPLSPFNFNSTAYSHGWVVLAPNVWDSERQTVQRTERLGNGKVVFLSIFNEGSIERPNIAIDVGCSGGLSKKERKEISSSVANMFRIDEDLSEFYSLCRKRGKRWVNLTRGLGRLLRSPTVFEDVVKCICTTNIQWGGTKRMIENLVNAFGDEHPDNPDLKAFPTAEAIAAVPAKAFAKKVSLGYRSDYIHTLAKRVTTGELVLEALREKEIPTPELKKKLMDIKGVGNYAAATLLMLLGRYDELAIDTVFREFVAKKYFKGQRPADKEAESIYADWGKWKYLAYWYDLWEGLDVRF